MTNSIAFSQPRVGTRFGMDGATPPKQTVLARLQERNQQLVKLKPQREARGPRKWVRETWRKFKDYLNHRGIDTSFKAFLVGFPLTAAGIPLTISTVSKDLRAESEKWPKYYEAVAVTPMREMSQWAKANNDTQAINQIQFRIKIQNYQDQMIRTLAQSKDPSQQALAKKLQYQQTLNQATGLKLAADLSDKLSRPGVTLNEETIGDFVQNQPVLRELSRTEQQALSHLLAQTLQKASQETPNSSLEQLQETGKLFSVYVQGNSSTPAFHGIYLQDLAKVETKADAIAFFNKMADSDYYIKLSPADRNLYKAIGNKMLDAMDYPYTEVGLWNGPLMGLGLLGAMFGIALLLVGGVVTLPTMLKDTFRKSNWQAMMQGLQAQLHPNRERLTLIRQPRDTDAVDALKKEVQSRFDTMNSLRREACDAHPELKALLMPPYKVTAGPYTHETFTWEDAITNLVHRQFNRNGVHKVTEKAFYQAMLDAADQAIRDKQFLPEFSIKTAQETNSPVSLEGPLTQLEQQHNLGQLQQKMIESYVRYLNYLVQETQDHRAVAKLQETDPEGKRAKLELTQQLRNKAKELVDTYEEQLLALQVQFVEQATLGEQEAARVALRQMELERQRLGSNPLLNSLQTDNQLKKFLNDARENAPPVQAQAKSVQEAS